MLRTGIRLEGLAAADNAWLTCCGLHNFLLEEDGLVEEWQGAICENDVDEMRRFTLLAMQRLSEADL